ncbi:hypothetical protein KI387_036138, partial [Taxus chinensis]
MHDGESVEAFLRRVAELRAELSALGEPVDDKLLVPLTLRALPSRFRTLITTLTITQQEVSFATLVNYLQQEEAMQNVQEAFEDKALIMRQKHKPRKGQSAPQNQKQHAQQPSSQRPPQRPPQKQHNHKVDRWCHICSTDTHTTANCYYNGRKYGNSGEESTSGQGYSKKSRWHARNQRQKGHIAAQQDATSDEEVPDTTHSDIVLVSQTSQPSEDVWLIDSGASKHMTGNKKLFHTLSDRPTGDQITIADNQEYIAAGIGDVIIPLGTRRCTLTKVLYVP